MTSKKFASTTERNRTWTNRRKFGAALVEAGAISDADLAALERVKGAVDGLVALAGERRAEGMQRACTAAGGALDMRGKLS